MTYRAGPHGCDFPDDASAKAWHRSHRRAREFRLERDDGATVTQEAGESDDGLRRSLAKHEIIWVLIQGSYPE